jgi:undecaprenyl-diphosphatase
MTILQSILLGIIQGLTEFLPISSSGHLVIIPKLLGWQIPSQEAFIFDVLVQVATLLAVIAYFWQELISIIQAFFAGLVRRAPFEDPFSRLGWYLILATIPAGVIGLTIKDLVEQAFNSLAAAGFFLLITAGLLLLAERLGKRSRKIDQMNWIDAIWIGFFQALAIFPGVSRSGATMTGAMLRGLERPSSARFSFLMSIPIMLAAGLSASLDLLDMPNVLSSLPVFIPGFLTAAVVGYISIRWLIGYLTHHPLTVFSIYCALVGTLAIVVSFIGK